MLKLLQLLHVFSAYFPGNAEAKKFEKLSTLHGYHEYVQSDSDFGHVSSL